MNSRPELLPLRSTHQAQPVAARWSLDWSERFIPTESLCNEQHNVLNKTYISQFPMRSQQNPAVNSQKGLLSGPFVESHQVPSFIHGNTSKAVLPYPPSLFHPPLSMPLKTRAVEKSAPYLEIAAHPKFEELMRAIFFVRQIGEKPEQQRRLSELHKRSTENIVRARKELGQQQRSSDPDLEQLLTDYLKLLNGLNQELVLTHNEANHACTMFEQQIRGITQAASDMVKPVALCDTDQDHLRQVLKRKYPEDIRMLNDEFKRKRKKGKLPVDATDLLRTWWDDNLAWPYPTEDEKRSLAKQTDLSQTQINNWFINQRKRHWHKFFHNGRLPQTRDEAIEILRAQGVITNL